MSNIFEKINKKNFSLFGFSPYAVFQNINVWRKYITLLVIVTSICWLIFGFDSTWSALQPFGKNFTPLLTGQISLTEVWQQSQMFYGIGNHFSAPVIYGIAFIILSLYFEKLGIKRSLNFFSTAALSLMSIGIFEWIYNPFYATFQNQPWVIIFVWKQVTNLYNFTIFIIVGLLVLLYLYGEGYKPNLSKVTLSLFLISTIFWATWVFYPFPTQQISVETTSGIWTSTQTFPQTMYAVDIDPTDGKATGVPFNVENNLLHAVNLLTKVFSTCAILSFCMLKPTKKVKNVEQHSYKGDLTKK